MSKTKTENKDLAASQVDALVSVLTHDEFELDKAAQESAKEYGGAGSFKDGGLWMLDWLIKKVKKELKAH